MIYSREIPRHTPRDNLATINRVAGNENLAQRARVPVSNGWMRERVCYEKESGKYVAVYAIQPSGLINYANHKFMRMPVYFAIRRPLFQMFRALSY